ncbi:MAG: DUF1700 domain-containing protein [Anaerovoracaceae bacterium]
MKKNEYLEELRRRLKSLPDAEIESAVSYYEEYFSDASLAGTEDVDIEKLGTPAAVAGKIIGECAIEDADKNKPKTKTINKKKGITIGVIIVAILASPIALPIAITVIAVVFSLLVALFSVVLSFGVTAIALGVSGIAAFLIGLYGFTASAATAVFYMGSGLACMGLGVLFAILVYKVAPLAYRGIKKLLGKFLVKEATK